MIKEGLICQATGVQLLINATERTPVKELPGLMQRLQKEFRPVGVSPQAAAPATSVPTSATATTVTPSAAPATSTPAAKVKVEHGDPFHAQPISKCKVEGDVVSYTYQCPLCNDPPHHHNQHLQSLYQQASGVGASVYGLFVVLVQSGHTQAPHA